MCSCKTNEISEQFLTTHIVASISCNGCHKDRHCRNSVASVQFFELLFCRHELQQTSEQHSRSLVDGGIVRDQHVLQETKKFFLMFIWLRKFNLLASWWTNSFRTCLDQTFIRSAFFQVTLGTQHNSSQSNAL